MRRPAGWVTRASVSAKSSAKPMRLPLGWVARHPTAPPTGATGLLAPRDSARTWLQGVLSKRQEARARALYGATPTGAAVPHALAAATAMAAVRRAFQGAYSDGYVASWRRTQLYYESFVGSVGLNPYPVEAAPLMMFLTDRVVRLGLEPAGLGSTLTALRAAVDLQGLGWRLDEVDDRVLRMVRTGLAKEFKGQNCRGQKEPLRLTHLENLLATAERDGRAETHQLLLQTQLAHGGMLRTAEHTEGRLLVGHVQFLVEDGAPGRHVRFMHGRNDVVGVRLSLVNAKTGKGDATPQAALIGRRSDGLDAVGPLWDYFEAHGLNNLTRAREPLFCKLDDAGRRIATQPVSGSDFRGGLATLLTRAGYPAARFGGHSPRRGGCNDLFDDGVALDIVMKAGRWKSTAWMVYRELTPAAMRRMAAAPPQRGTHPLGSLGPRLLSSLKASLGSGREEDSLVPIT